MFDNTPYHSMSSFPRMFDRIVTINRFSKSYAMTGWRLGYVAGAKDLVSPMLNLKYALTICTPAVSQMAALAALTGPQDCLRETLSTYDARDEELL